MTSSSKINLNYWLCHENECQTEVSLTCYTYTKPTKQHSLYSMKFSQKEHFVGNGKSSSTQTQVFWSDRYIFRSEFNKQQSLTAGLLWIAIKTDSLPNKITIRINASKQAIMVNHYIHVCILSFINITTNFFFWGATYITWKLVGILLEEVNWRHWFGKHKLLHWCSPL